MREGGEAALAPQAVGLRASWAENRAQSDGSIGVYLMIADFDGDRVRVFERSTWEMRWFEAAVTPERASCARSILRG
jgi:hypothetical protein